MIDGHKIVVTMTSWKQRISTVASLIFEFYQQQTQKPDKFYLWLSLEEFPNKEADLPADLVQIKKSGIIDLRWLPGNEQTFKRWHVYPEHWDDYVFVIDDDCHYSPTLIVDALEVLQKNPKTICNIWQQFSAIPTYDDDIKINFKYDFSDSYAIWICGNCVIPPKTFPLDALSENQVKFKDENFPSNDEVVLISYCLRDGIAASFLPKFFPFKTISNEAETSLKSNTGQKFNKFGYSEQEIQLYKQLKFLGLVDKYQKFHSGYNPENYERIVKKGNVWIKLVVTAHNNEKQIGKCLDTILEQTFSNFYVVVVNDYSKDKTLEIIRQKVSKNNNTIVISNKENLRQGISRNIGFEAGPTSEFVWFIDGDDYLPNNNILQNIYDQIIAYPDFDAYSMKYCIDDNQNVFVPSQMQFNTAYNRKCLFLSGTVAAWSRIHRTTSIDCQFLDIFHEDCIWFAEWLKKDRKIKDLDLVSYVYYQNENGECKRFLRHDPALVLKYRGFLSKMIEIFYSTDNIQLKSNIHARLSTEKLVKCQ